VIKRLLKLLKKNDIRNSIRNVMTS